MLTELLDLKNYITSTIGVNCIIGFDDISQGDYVRIVPSGLSFEVMNKKVVGTNNPVSLEITVDRDNTIGGYELLEKLIKDINGFDYYSGSELLEEGTTEYTENNFVITVILNLKTIIQGA